MAFHRSIPVSSRSVVFVVALIAGGTVSLSVQDARADAIAPSAAASADRNAQRRRPRRRRGNAPTETPPTAPVDTETPPVSEQPPPPVTPEPPPPPPPPAPRPVALDASLAFRGIGRSLGYSGDPSGTFRGYDLPFGPSLFASVEWFPGAHFTSNALAHIGLYGDFGVAFAIQSEDTAGTRFGSNSMVYDVGLRGRIPLGALDLGIRAGYGAQTFAIDNDGTTATQPPGVPAVNYQFVRLGVSGRYDVANRVSVMLGVDYLLTLGAGELRDTYFPHDGIHGIAGRVAVAVRIIAGLEARVGFDMAVFLHTFNVPSGSTWNATGATDLFYGLTIGLAYRL